MVFLAFKATLSIGDVDLRTQALNFWPRGLDAYFTSGQKAQQKDHFRYIYLINVKLHLNRVIQGGQVRGDQK